MITVLYFASLREKLKLASEEIELPPEVDSIESLVELLTHKHNANWVEVLVQSKVLVAVNQSLTQFSASIKDGDEVAFFPPVTGG